MAWLYGGVVDASKVVGCASRVGVHYKAVHGKIDPQLTSLSENHVESISANRESLI